MTVMDSTFVNNEKQTEKLLPGIHLGCLATGAMTGLICADLRHVLPAACMENTTCT